MVRKKEIRHLTPEQKKIVNDLDAMRSQLGISTDAEFVRRYIAGEMSASTWRRLKADVYTGTPEPHVEVCRRILARLEDMVAVQRGRDIEAAAFFELPVFKSVFDAITIARERTDCKRLVIYLAQQGGGKSAICEQLRRRYNALSVSVMPSWRKSYFASCSDVCRAGGLGGPWRSTKDVESCMLRFLNEEPRLIAMDEGNTLGAESLNMIKVILNETRCTVFLAALPELFDLITNKSWFESKQVIRRSVAIIDLDEYPIAARDVKPFLKDFKISKDDASSIYKVIGEAANRFAAFDMIKAIRENLTDICDGKTVTLDDAETAVAIAEKMWRLHKGRPEKKGVRS